ncbi:hypothetical protein DEU56DRAFT_830141 [Suillus clintonianus]|uniref:uncharacterized protein n=1 Tax=Suillus clintonianus TaxID=1904413 RepID=UPI001B87B149|nr:uncharacterized protein DEU56DRAFT_830141 [Suillus clintonianus]KAG2123282.1 hypothetical protein DEU56DRAFT_830141 [Suillus clintonianus]
MWEPLTEQVFSSAPVYDLIFCDLSPRTLVRLSLTCRTTHKAVTRFFKRAYNVNRHLSHYFPDPLSFRSLQARTGLVISGSNALQFLDRTFYPESDLDVYSHAGHVYEVLEWIESTGYKFEPHKYQGEDWHDHVSPDWDGTVARTTRFIPTGEDVRSTRYSNIAEVYTFKRLVDIGGELVELQIQVIETICNPIDTIMKYHSTCVMNIITFNAAYSFYPIATFEDRSAVKIPGSRHRPDVLAKYVKRGWRVYSVFRPKDIAQPYKSPFLPNVTRWVGDRHCWTIPLDTSGVGPRTASSPSSEQFSWDPSTQNGWIMKTMPAAMKGLSVPDMDYNPITTTIFRYNYIVPSESLASTIRGWAFSQGKLNHEILTRHNWTWCVYRYPNRFSCIHTCA